MTTRSPIVMALACYLGGAALAADMSGKKYAARQYNPGEGRDPSCCRCSQGSGRRHGHHYGNP
jgi:hypothetical protein